MTQAFARPFRPIRAETAVIEDYDPAAIGRQLQAEENYVTTGRNSLALVRSRNLTVVVTALRKGVTMREHRAPGPATVVVLQGAAVFHGSSDSGVHLTPGKAVVFSSNTVHSVTATDNCLYLIHIGGRTVQSALEADPFTTKEDSMANPSTYPQLDVRSIDPSERHSRIFALYESLEGGEFFELVNDHDPRPLQQQFSQRYPGAFEWDYVESGPTVWRVRIGKSQGDHCCI